MQKSLKRGKGLYQIIRIVLTLINFCIASIAFSQNDLCDNAGVVTISGNGFDFGTFISSINDISGATIEAGETFAPAILVAGQTQKSIWYKFSLPTNRSVKVTLAQNGSAIQAGDIGFTVYKTSSCLPGALQISSKLTPIGVFGNTFHPCVESGDYLVQVSSKAAANGPVYISVDLAATTSLYDNRTNPYQFGTLSAPNFTKSVDYAIDCQTIENTAESCTALSNYQQFNKSTWHTFTTPAYFDYVAVLLSGTGTPTYFTNAATFEKFGYNLYSGDAKTAPNSLTLVSGCDSLLSNGYSVGTKVYKCNQLQPNTTYSIQLFFRNGFNNNIKLAVAFDGTAPTQAPESILSLIPASNKLGMLAASQAGIVTTVSDQLGCNSQHNLHPCPPALPLNGIKGINNPFNYALSTFFTFTTSNASKITIGGSDLNTRYNSTPLIMRLFAQDITDVCSSLDTNKLVYPPFFSNSGFSLDCLPAGKYTLQVTGRDSLVTNYLTYSHLTSPTYSLGIFSDLGKRFRVSITIATRNNVNKYDLKATGSFDTLNRVNGVMAALVPGITYNSQVDTFSCNNTVLPSDTSCLPSNLKAMYREFKVADSGVISITTTTNFWYKLYNGDADALSTAQGVRSYPARVSGLTPYSLCFLSNECSGRQMCLVPGTYTLATFGSSANIGQTDRPQFKFAIVNTSFNSLSNAENMGDVLGKVPASGGSVTSALDYYSCKDNAVPIAGIAPCNYSGQPATKAIYRQFYLSAPANISISGSHAWPNGCGVGSSGSMSLFAGKASDGVAALSALPTSWRCAGSLASAACAPLDSGWYTLVTYGSGPSYEKPFQALNQSGYGSYVNRTSRVTITVTIACPAPKYNRPYKAAVDSVTRLPFLVEWKPRLAHTAVTPKTDTTYTLYRENFNCTVDTPFSAHPIPNCNASLVKVAYYVFRTTQESFVQIDTKGFWAAVYKGDARKDSATFGTSTVIQTCLQQSGYIQICKLQPGEYTLAVFASATQNCISVTPTVYIDQVGHSRFDHASNAYDFGVVPPDSLYHNGKTGDINPLHPGRAASNDFIYCTTGAQPTNPSEAVCGADFNSRIYNTGLNNMLYNGTQNATPNPYNIARRNLWYTFVANQGGYVRIKVNNKTPGKQYQYSFAVYKSDVNGTLPFTSVVNAGLVDSTLAQGLTYIGQNASTYYCSTRPNEFAFYRDPCSPGQDRYYILVENTNSYPYEYPGMTPNSQLDVSILLDSVNAIKPLFDHYYQANDIGSNLGAGTHAGATDNYSCATRGTKDPVWSYPASTCSKTLWYKFTTTVTGIIQFRAVINGLGTSNYSPSIIQLFKEIRPGDSTVTGLQIMNSNSPRSAFDPAINGYWGQTCISPGTYYILLPGCAQLNEYVYPQIKIIEQAGDFCSRPVNAVLNGAGTRVSSVLVDCHTIGTDYGEFNPTLSCPNGALKQNYKTSWFKISIGGTDTLDVTTFLTENTNALPAEIKYRLMNGNCGAMQERSCVQDAQTRDTYKCLSPGEYFIQVFIPVTNGGVPVTGTIDLNLSAIKHADTCAPVAPCLANAAFISQFDCNTGDSVTFINFSTYGSAIQYLWDFGYAGQTATQVAPKFKYPELATSQTYTVRLTVINTNCLAPDNTSTITASITIPGRPQVNIGNDTTICKNGSQLLLNATSWTGSTYQWQNNSTGTTFNVTTSGTYHVRVTYNGCVKRDTIVVNINTINPLNQTKILCGNDSVQLSSLRNLGETYLWNTGSVNNNIYVRFPGLYTNLLNWRGCTVTDSFRVSLAAPPFITGDTTVCFPFKPFSLRAAATGALSYQWQNGTTGNTFNVTTTGLYWVRVNYPNCFIRDSIQVNVSPAPTANSMNVYVCAGQSYTLPWGRVVNAAGVYPDTIRNEQGCDSVRNSVNLVVQTAQTTTINAVIFAGQTYTLPWGTVVDSAGIYRDTLRYTTGCDSVRRIVNLSIQSSNAIILYATICAGSSYTLPNGKTANATGTYSDTLRFSSGFDSLTRTVYLTVQEVRTDSADVVLCSGQSLILPWGTTVNVAGIYRDTIRYSTGCDSLRRSVRVFSLQPVSTILTDTICDGQSFVLPWGLTVNEGGTYHDTLRSINGCDSIRITVHITLQRARSTVLDTTICKAATYTLPWGMTTNVPGLYADTLYYMSGCDSVRRSVNLKVLDLATSAFDVVICSGQNYVLPSGRTVGTTGIYSDTLSYARGCDSSISRITLIVLQPLKDVQKVILCEGATYTLPTGKEVSTPGIYTDTLRSVMGCDSIVKTVDLAVQKPISSSTGINICSGQAYTLPWGITINASGIYRDTLRSMLGCDSLSRMVNVTVHDAREIILNETICAGQLYQLPWGKQVSVTGIYKDTLYYQSGCDSIIHTVNLVVKSPKSVLTNVTSCAGQNYTLPWGKTVNTSGTYRDTVRYTIGCDSLLRVVNLTVQAPTIISYDVAVCSGQVYTLPWGKVVNTGGIYRDTLHYLSGCDSVLYSIQVIMQSAVRIVANATICSNQTYPLPWGPLVNIAGTYRDTIHYLTGCDSLIRVINLAVTTPASTNLSGSICSGEIYTLPWGTKVNVSGIYRDTVKSAGGCDSLIRTVNLVVQSTPTLRLTKSNDVNCITRKVSLHVSGAARYQWSPANNLSDPKSPNPIANPDKTTTYVVTGTGSNGCIARDSIEVKLLTIDPQKGYLVASSFTPNNDGLNDCFGVPYWGTVHNFSLTIYNRYGIAVFSTNNSANCWDGIHKGIQQNPGAYVYYIKADGICGPVTKKGTVMLVR